jgi:hypothetical protein
MTDVQQNKPNNQVRASLADQRACYQQGRQYVLDKNATADWHCLVHLAHKTSCSERKLEINQFARHALSALPTVREQAKPEQMKLNR